VGGGWFNNPNDKKCIFVQSSAQANWCHLLDVTPRNALTKLPVHDIPDGSDKVNPFDSESERI
jgi:hypothetical protein